ALLQGGGRYHRYPHRYCHEPARQGAPRVACTAGGAPARDRGAPSGRQTGERRMSDTPEKSLPADEVLVMLCADLEADGMLSSDQRAGLRAVLARNPRLNELYESFRFIPDPLASPFEAALTLPIPERLLRRFARAPRPERGREGPARPGPALRGSAR